MAVGYPVDRKTDVPAVGAASGKRPGRAIPRRGSLTHRLSFGCTLLVTLAVLVAGCAPVAPGAQPEQTGAAPSSAAPVAPKVLRIGLNSDAEPKEGGIAYGGGGAGGSESMWFLHASLTNYDDQGTLQPRTAERVPTLENGDWQAFPDGTMEVTWKLRTGVQWHDGTPIHAEDFILGYRVGVDPEMFQRGTAVLRQIATIAAPDPQTLVVRWKNPYIYANHLDLANLVPLPRHKFAALWDAGDKQAFTNNRAWFEEWVGLGPYRMKEWVQGSHIEAEAYDGYFLGRPKIDRVSIRFFGDMNTLLATVMSGDIHLVPVGSLKEDEAHVLKSQWADAGAGSITLSANKLRYGAWQFRDPSAPWAQDARVRQALVVLIDRENLVNSILNGLSAADDIMLTRQDPAYRLAQQAGLPKLGYDVAQAHRLLGEAGLVRGGDGTYRTRGGQPFALEVTSTGEINTNIQQLLAITDAWKTAGLQPTNVIIPGTANDKEIRAKAQGVSFTSGDLSYRTFEGFLTSATDSDANRWRGGNIGGYSNPAYDQLYPLLLGTLRSAERDPIAAQMVKLLLDDVAYIPIAYSSDVTAMNKSVRGVTGVLPLQRITGWNAHLWEVQ